MASLTISNPALTSLTSALSGTPSAGDSVFLNEGFLEFLSDVDLTATDLVLFHATALFAGKFDSAPLRLVCNQTSTGRLKVESNSDVFRVRSSSTSGVIHTIDVAMGRAGGRFHLATCDTENLTVRAGTAYQETDADVANVFVGSGGQFISRAGSAVVGVLTNNGGTVDLGRDVTALNCNASNGQAGITKVTSTTCTPTTINLNGGTLRLEKCGNIGTINGNSGVLDLSALSSLVTITTFNQHPDLTIVYGPSTITPTISTTNSFGNGPKIVRN